MGPEAMQIASLVLGVVVARSALAEAMSSVKSYLQERERDLFVKFRITSADKAHESLLAQIRDAKRAAIEEWKKTGSNESLENIRSLSRAQSGMQQLGAGGVIGGRENVIGAAQALMEAREKAALLKAEFPQMAAKIDSSLVQVERSIKTRFKIGQIPGGERAVESLISVQKQIKTLEAEFPKLQQSMMLFFAAAAAGRSYFKWIDGVATDLNKLNEAVSHFETTMKAMGRGENFLTGIRKQTAALAREAPMELERAEDMMRQAATKLPQANAEQVAAVVKRSLGLAQMSGENPHEILQEQLQLFRLRQAAEENPMFAEEASQLGQRAHRRFSRLFPAQIAAGASPQQQELEVQKLSEKGWQALQKETTKYRQSLTDVHNAQLKMGRSFDQAFGQPAQTIKALWNNLLSFLFEKLNALFTLLQKPFFRLIITAGMMLTGVIISLAVAFTVLTFAVMAYNSALFASFVASAKQAMVIVLGLLPALWGYIMTMWSVVTAQLAALLSNPFTAALAAIAIGAIAAMCIGMGVYISKLQDAQKEQEGLKDGMKFGEGAKLPQPAQTPGGFKGFRQFREDFFKQAYIQSMPGGTSKKPEEQTAEATTAMQRDVASIAQGLREGRGKNPPQAEVRLT